MDALARLAPVARPLLRDVDDALATLGAPPEHPVWALLRRVGATPGRRGRRSSPTCDPDRLRPVAGDAARAGRRPTTRPACPVDGAVARARPAHAYAVRGGRARRAPARRAADGSLAGRLRATAVLCGRRGGLAAAQPGPDRPGAGRGAHVQPGGRRFGRRRRVELGGGLRVADPAAGLGRRVAAAADVGARLLGVAEDAVRLAESCAMRPGRRWPSCLPTGSRIRGRRPTRHDPATAIEHAA